MGKHAKPRPPRGRQVAAVSTGTLLLCMWATGTALAASTPYAAPSDGLDGTTSTITSTTTNVLNTLAECTAVARSI